MNTQIYLLLVRDVNVEFEHGKMAALKFVTQFGSIVKNFIQGDSLDLPFLRMIRVDSVEHSIGFSGKKTTYHGKDDVGVTSGHDNPDYAGDFREMRKLRGSGKSVVAVQRKLDADRSGARVTEIANTSFDDLLANQRNKKWNEFMRSKVPDHGDFIFTKQPDNATPQLAYGCSSQEIFPLAVFCFRRKRIEHTKSTRVCARSKNAKCQ